MDITVRKAVPSDGRLILSLVEALAAYEKLAPPDEDAGKRLLADLFSARPRLECYIAESEGRAAGYAFVLETYSSFLALPTLYMEDLFVLPEYRGKRAGFALFLICVCASPAGAQPVLTAIRCGTLTDGVSDAPRKNVVLPVACRLLT